MPRARGERRGGPGSRSREPAPLRPVAGPLRAACACSRATWACRAGWSEARFRQVALQVQAVYHCGAQVHWGAPLSALAEVNVGGTCEAPRLRGRGRRSAGSPGLQRGRLPHRPLPWGALPRAGPPGGRRPAAHRLLPASGARRSSRSRGSAACRSASTARASAGKGQRAAAPRRTARASSTAPSWRAACSSARRPRSPRSWAAARGLRRPGHRRHVPAAGGRGPLLQPAQPPAHAPADPTTPGSGPGATPWMGLAYTRAGGAGCCP
ncbi:MAG: SDR family oxidoreductase [Alphaproteobacteria bacterium]|nr:SDR family oxidoreductase [Alphaproteobacteria bacterium]